MRPAIEEAEGLLKAAGALSAPGRFQLEARRCNQSTPPAG